MTLWIKQPDAEEVTGTVVMLLPNDSGDKPGHAMKQTKTGIILNPQPHDNPNDPLNWPVWRRDLVLFVIGLYSFMVGGVTPLLAPVLTDLKVDWDRPFKDITYLVGVAMLGMAVGSLVFAPIAVLYGKRLVYLITQPILLAACIWGAVSHSYGSLIGARFLMGFGGGPAESLPSASIAEIYFAHERAYRLGIYTLLMLGGKNLVPLVAGFVSVSLGWHWILWLYAIIIGALWILTAILVHETWWDRTPVPDKRSLVESEAAALAREKLHRPPFTQRFSIDGGEPSNASLRHATTHSEETAPNNESVSVATRTPFFKNLNVYTGRQDSNPLWMVFLRPFYLYLYPPILFASFLYGSSVIWLSVIAETISTIFMNEPYNFKQTSVGLLYAATFTGSCLGSAAAGQISDMIVRALSRRSNGIYEPEYRLVMIIPVLVMVTMGLVGFGWSTFEENHWIVPAIFLGILGFGTSLGSTIAITYAIDSYRGFAAESLVALNFLKNVLGFVFGIFVPIFLDASGLRISYGVYGAMQATVCLFAIPLYHYGKVIRAYRDKHNIIRQMYRDR